MAWLAIDKYGNESIFDNCPIRTLDGMWEDPVYESFDGQGGKPILHHYTDIDLLKVQ